MPRPAAGYASPMIRLSSPAATVWSVTPEDRLRQMAWRRTRGRDAARAAEKGSRDFARWLRDAELESAPLADDALSIAETVDLARSIELRQSATLEETGQLLGGLLAHRSRLRVPDLLTCFQTAVPAAVLAVEQLETAAEPPPLAPRAIRDQIELPLLIGTLFRSVQGAAAVRKSARVRAAAEWEHWTDRTGLPHRSLLSDDPQSQQSAQTLLRLADYEAAGRTVGDAAEWLDSLLQPVRRRTARLGSELSEWAGVAVCQSQKPAVRVTCCYGTEGVATRVDLRAPLLADWEVDVRIDGALVPTDDWRSVCWFSDEEADYLELQSDVTTDLGTVRLTRQIMLAKSDQWLYLAASAVASDGDRVSIEHRFAAAAGTEWEPDPRDRLLWFRDPTKSEVLGRLVPLGVESDRFRPAAGVCRWQPAADESAGGPGSVIVAGESETASCVPVAIELSPKRQVQPLDWSPLTVAEFGRPCPLARAGGWRLRSGDDQWLIYQSLTPPTSPRTVLGMHTNQEAVFARFSDGTIDPIVAVEADD